MRKLTVLILLVLTTLPGLFSITGHDVMSMVDEANDPKSSRSAIKLEIIGSDGSVKERMIESWSMKDNTDNNMSVMVFRAPSAVKNTRFLTKEVTNADDDQWIYLPALGKVRRIVSGDGDSSFMGTEFTYDDMSSRDVDEDTHKILREEVFGNYNCWVVESIPVDPEDSAYSKSVWWIIKDDNMLLPVKAELYDKKGVLKKVLTAEQIVNRGGYWTADKLTMENVQNGRSSILSTLNSMVDVKVNPRYFSKRYLQTGKVK